MVAKFNKEQAAVDNRLGFLHGIKSQILKQTRVQLDLTLDIDIALNKKLQRTHLSGALLRGESGSPVIRAHLNSAIKQLNNQNQVLKKLDNELNKTAIIGPGISAVERKQAEKMREQLLKKIGSLEAGNRDLLAKANEGKVSVERPKDNANQDNQTKGPGRRHR